MNSHLMYINLFVASFNSSNTKKMYLTDLFQYFEYVSSRNIDSKEYLNITLETVNNYLNKLVDAKMSPSSIQRKIYSISSFYEFLVQKNVVNINFWKNLDLPKINPKISKNISIEQLEDFLFKIKHDGEITKLHRAILFLLFSTGMKKSELLNLKIKDFHNNRNTPYVVIKTKSNEQIFKHLTMDTYSAISDYLNQLEIDGVNLELDSYLFRPSKNPMDGELNKPLNPKSVDYIVKTWSLKLGFEKRLSTQDARDSRIKTALDLSSENFNNAQSEFGIQRKAIKNYINMINE